MFSVVMTWIPSARMSWTSWYRLGFRLPGTLVWASSSMRATWGFRARTAERSISSRTTPRYSWRRRGTTSSPSISFAVSARPWVSTSPTTTSIPSSLRRCPSSSIWYVFPTPAPYPRYTFSRPRPARRISRRKVSARSSCMPVTSYRPDRGSASVRSPEALRRSRGYGLPCALAPSSGHPLSSSLGPRLPFPPGGSRSQG